MDIQNLDYYVITDEYLFNMIYRGQIDYKIKNNLRFYRFHEKKYQKYMDIIKNAGDIVDKDINLYKKHAPTIYSFLHWIRHKLYRYYLEISWNTYFIKAKKEDTNKYIEQEIQIYTFFKALEKEMKIRTLGQI